MRSGRSGRSGQPPRPPRTARASWWARRSLRARLTAAAAAVLAVGMSGAAVLLLWWLHTSLTAQLDDLVLQQARSVAAQAEQGRLPRSLPESDDRAPLVQVVDGSGAVVSSSADLVGHPRLFTLPGDTDGSVRSVVPALTRHAENDLSDGSYRVAVVRADSSGGAVDVYAALSTEEVVHSTSELASALAVGVPVVVLSLGLVGWLLLGSALRPVEELRRQAAAIPGTDLHRRLEPPPAGDELTRLAETLNDLLTRIEVAGNRQSQFVADAAHELRSPVATIRAQLEVLRRGGDASAAAAALPGLLGDTERLSTLVDDLLALARMDAGASTHRQAVDLDEIVMDLAGRSRGRGVRIDLGGVLAGRVLGDPGALTRMVANLLDNGTRHAATLVTVSLSADQRWVRLVVADDGPGIPPADRERVFERFVRLDDARTRDLGGAGLGLAIVHDVVRSHAGSVAIEDNDPGARLVVLLPALC